MSSKLFPLITNFFSGAINDRSIRKFFSLGLLLYYTTNKQTALLIHVICKGKDKVRPITCHAGPEGMALLVL